MNRLSEAEAGLSSPRAPWTAVLVTVICVLVMLALGSQLWDRLPETIVTREAREGVSQTELSKLFLVLSGPALLTVCALVLSGSQWAGTHILPRYGITPEHSRRTRAVAMNALALLFGPLVVLIHGAVLADAAEYDVPLTRLVAVGVGLFMAGVGNLLPKLGPEVLPNNPRMANYRRAWHSAQRPGGLAMIVLGLLTAAAALWLPPGPVLIVASFLVVFVFAFMMVVALRRVGR